MIGGGKLMRRSEALSPACVAVEDWSARPEARADALEVLSQMRAEASRNLELYRREVSLE